MYDIIDETLKIATERFKKFGFKEEQITKLLKSGKDDLEKETLKLVEILKTQDIDIKKLNDSLHALKGLCLNMGNNSLADKLVEFRDSLNTTKLDELKQIFKIK
jgi:hypothetical protein